MLSVQVFGPGGTYRNTAPEYFGLMGVAHEPLRRRHSGKGRAVPERPPVDPYSLLRFVAPWPHQRSRVSLKARAQSGLVIGKSMNHAQEQEHFAQADRHLAELKAHIVRQSLILRRTLAEGRRLLVAKSTLQALEGSLRIFEKRCELILDQLKRPPSE
jgi:hypothetical protein